MIAKPVYDSQKWTCAMVGLIISTLLLFVWVIMTPNELSSSKAKCMLLGQAVVSEHLFDDETKNFVVLYWPVQVSNLDVSFKYTLNQEIYATTTIYGDFMKANYFLNKYYEFESTYDCFVMCTLDPTKGKIRPDSEPWCLAHWQ
jgi:hypothetical protein